MTQTPAAPDWGRSVGAVVAGFICTALLSVGTDAFMYARGIFPAPGEAMSEGLFLWAATYRLAFTVLGGYMTAALAPHRPMSHVLILGTIGALAATAGAVAAWNAGPAFGPRWYPILLVVTALPCVWAGGMLQMRRQQAT
jgi:peptidoglycan/LPS O-acetylase OafA/YrhL